MMVPPGPDDVVPERWQLYAVNLALAGIIVVAGGEAVRSLLVLLT